MHSNWLVSPKEFFHSLVKEGLSKRKIETIPLVELYLTDLLQHYMCANNFFMVDEDGRKKQETLAEMFLRAQGAESTAKVELLKRLGDRSLYVSGFFGDSLNRKIVDIDYYANMGGRAYGILSSHVKEDTVARVYKVFSTRFLDFVEVLTYISNQSLVKSDESILRLYERYLRTGSELAKEKLIEMGVMTLPSDQSKLAIQN